MSESESGAGIHRATFVHGLTALPRGGLYLARNPRLWPWAALPLLINVVIFAILFVAAVRYLLPGLVDWLTPADVTAFPAWFPQWLTGALGTLGGWLKPLLRFFLWLLSLVLLVLVGAVSFTAIGCVIAAPFLDALSERVENLVLGRSLGVPFSLSALMEDAARTVWMTLTKLLIVTAVFLLTLPMMLVPLVGQVAYTVVNSVVSIWFLAVEFVDFPMARGGWCVAERRAWAARRRPTLFGFGTSVYLVCLVPFMGFLVLPAAVTSATLLFIETTPAAELPDHAPDSGSGGDRPSPGTDPEGAPEA